MDLIQPLFKHTYPSINNYIYASHYLLYHRSTIQSVKTGSGYHALFIFNAHPWFVMAVLYNNLNSNNANITLNIS